MLKIDNLQFHVAAFSLELSLELRSRVTGLYGPSGAGKTTLLEIIAGLKKPRHGTIVLSGRELFNASARTSIPAEKRNVGYVPQDLALFHHKSVCENLQYGSRVSDAEYSHIVSEFRLEPLLDRRPHQLSGGEKQRVAIGRALMTQPALLMLDEPLSSLDESLKSRALDLFRHLKDEFDLPLLYVSHDANELAQICDEIVVIQSGRAKRQGAVAAVFNQIAEPRFVYRPENP